MLPDRTMSSEGRIILDMRIPNAVGDKRNHPPALQPRHAQLARKGLGGTPVTRESVKWSLRGMSPVPSNGIF